MNEDVPTVHPEWLHHTAHVLLMICFFPFYWMVRKYNHSDPKYGRKLAIMNIIGSVYSFLLEITIQATPVGCIFFCNLSPSFQIYLIHLYLVLLRFRNDILCKISKQKSNHELLVFYLKPFIIFPCHFCSKLNGISSTIDALYSTKPTNVSISISSEFSMRNCPFLHTRLLW